MSEQIKEERIDRPWRMEFDPEEDESQENNDNQDQQEESGDGENEQNESGQESGEPGEEQGNSEGSGSGEADSGAENDEAGPEDGSEGDGEQGSPDNSGNSGQISGSTAPDTYTSGSEGDMGDGEGSESPQDVGHEECGETDGEEEKRPQERNEPVSEATEGDSPEISEDEIAELAEKAMNVAESVDSREDYEERPYQYIPMGGQTSQNNKNAISTFKLTTEEKDRRLANAFARIISKVAEDLVGFPIEGDEEWDMNAIMKRKLDKRTLPHCKQSRERERVILVLDTSGSCFNMAEFYAKIAEMAVYYGDVEMYEGPNANLAREKNMITGDWDQLYRGATSNSYMITKGNYRWKDFTGRTIIFFGDWDGIRKINEIAQRNKIYYFDCAGYEGLCWNFIGRLYLNTESRWIDRKHMMQYYLRKHNEELSSKMHVFECYEELDLIQLAKKIR